MLIYEKPTLEMICFRLEDPLFVSWGNESGGGEGEGDGTELPGSGLFSDEDLMLWYISE
ncbi:MAG: hypothetical protein FWD16_01075 [Clostridia bacterium]|nr:hypothetical protein [Clostridia bacterium]